MAYRYNTNVSFQMSETFLTLDYIMADNMKSEEKLLSTRRSQMLRGIILQPVDMALLATLVNNIALRRDICRRRA